MCAQSHDIIFIYYHNWPAKPLIRHQTNIKFKATLSIMFLQQVHWMTTSFKNAKCKYFLDINYSKYFDNLINYVLDQIMLV